MSVLIEIINSKERLLRGKGISSKEIKKAEKKLGLSFSEDYKEYLRTYGIIAYRGHELTGISSSKRTDVVEVTAFEKKNTTVSEEMYVIEQTNYDGIVIWQDGEGIIYKTIMNSKPEIVCNSLADYIDL